MSNSLDFLKPIMHNRDEHIAIKLSGCIKNGAEMVLSNMLDSGYATWVEKYPGLEDLKFIKNVKELYYYLMKFTPYSFLEEVRHPHQPLTEREMKGDLSRLLGDLNDPSKCSVTSLELAIHEISKYEFCKSITVYDTALNDKSKLYIANLFLGQAGKVFVFEGFLKDLISKRPDITTYFIDDVEDLMAVMEDKEYNKEMDVFNEKQIFVNGLNAIKRVDDKGVPEYKYQQYMEDAQQRWNANVSWIAPHYIDIEAMVQTADLRNYVKPQDFKDKDSSL